MTDAPECDKIYKTYRQILISLIDGFQIFISIFSAFKNYESYNIAFTAHSTEPVTINIVASDGEIIYSTAEEHIGNFNMNKKVSDEVVDIIDNEDGVTNTLSALILVCGIGLALMIMYLLVS